MASRLPLVMGRAVTIDEWVDQDDGAEMVDCRDANGVELALLRLIRDPGLRAAYGERNERVVRERLTPPGPALDAVYRRLLEGPGRPPGTPARRAPEITTRPAASAR